MKTSQELQKMVDRIEALAGVFEDDLANTLDAARERLGEAVADLKECGL